MSGASKRKRKRAEETLINSLPKLSTFYTLNSNFDDSVASDDTLVNNSLDGSFADTSINDDNSRSTIDTVSVASTSNEPDTIPIEPAVEDVIENPGTMPDVLDFQALSKDPSLWPATISDPQRCDVVRRGPHHVRKYNFPFNDKRRRFTKTHYYRQLDNNERLFRRWLVYSTSTDEIFCFCCKLFGNTDVPLRSGHSTWDCLKKQLREHEIGDDHNNCLSAFLILEESMAAGKTIDDLELRLRNKEREFWRNVLRRLIDITVFLSERNLAFRGSDEHLGSRSNGNFLGLFELLAKYDPVLSQLRDRVLSSSSTDHYLSKRTQNELIGLISTKIEETNLTTLLASKYYSIILDCTPDVSHKEQLSTVLRSVECSPGVGCTVKENFFGYTKLDGTTGLDMLDVLLEKLGAWGLKVEDCRGQSYDNGANMKGKNSGVQARFLTINPKALYVPCGSHSYNLVVADSAKSSTASVTFFGTINRLYTLFSSSTARWDILKSHLDIVLKGHADTRWESWIKAIEPLRYNLSGVLDALDELESYAVKKGDGATTSDAKSLSANLSTWPFVLSVIIWYDILYQVNKSNNILQSTSTSLSVLQTEIRTTKNFLNDYRDTGYASACTTGREIAEKLEITIEFPAVRSRKKKRQFDYEGEDDVNQTPEEKFKTEFFVKLVDQAIVSVKERFKQLKSFYDLFGFLYTKTDLLATKLSGDLKKNCDDFAIAIGDVSSVELFNELTRFVVFLKSESKLVSAFDFLDYIYANSLLELYPNLAIALRVLLTVPVTVLSFGREKFLKTETHKNHPTVNNDRRTIKRPCAHIC